MSPSQSNMSPSQSNFDPLAGTISGAALFDDQEKTRFAQEELAREAEARRRYTTEEDRKRKEDESERDEERRHLEEIVAKQTKVLEDKLTQLAATMSPKGGDPDATQVQRAGVATVGDVSYPNAQSFPRADISLTGAPKKSSLPIILAVVLVLVLGGAGGGYMLLRSRATTTTPPTDPGRTNPPTGPPAKAVLVDIPGGTFQMGRNDSLPTEGPAHAVTINAFSMDKTEVTNAEYAQFVSDKNHTPPEQWGSVKPPVGQDLLPVSNVSYEDAVAFAQWRSERDGVTYRLPTEEEWEYAARNGDKDNLYPWGNTWMPGRAATQEAGVGKAQSVGTYPQGDNRWGIEDLIGNVWEWTSSKASVYPGMALKLPDVQKEWVVARGGSYSSQVKGERPLSGTMRDWFAPNYKNPVLGFRLVKAGS